LETTPLLDELLTGVSRPYDAGAPGRVPDGPCYDPGAVLGGELAVPCTCNPLQQG